MRRFMKLILLGAFLSGYAQAQKPDSFGNVSNMSFFNQDTSAVTGYEMERYERNLRSCIDAELAGTPCEGASVILSDSTLKLLKSHDTYRTSATVAFTDSSVVLIVAGGGFNGSDTLQLLNAPLAPAGAESAFPYYKAVQSCLVQLGVPTYR